VLYNDEGAVIGVATGDMGVEKTATQGPNFTRGMELLGKYVLIGEGVRGSLAKQLIAKFDLSKGPRAAEIRHRHQGALAGQAGESPARAWCSTPSAGRST
jgi:flavin-dependent dehydrogenase